MSSPHSHQGQGKFPTLVSTHVEVGERSGWQHEVASRAAVLAGKG